MPTINNIPVSDAEFTAMQERATAYICKRAFQDNKRFDSVEDIVKDTETKKGLEELFKTGGKKLFKFSLPIESKTPEDKWLNTFYAQQKKLLVEFSDAKFTVFNRDGGFMNFISELINDKFGISKKDKWDPADIWLIETKEKYREVIKKELEGPSGTQSIIELNAIMKKLFKERKVVGLSLKLISGKTARYEEVNVSEKFYDSLKGYDYTLGDITCKLGIKKDGTGQFTFETQDSIITLKGTQGPVAKFQIKGNTTSRLANLKFEPTEIGATSARLGKAPLDLVQKLSNFYNKKLYNNKYQNFPQDLKQFNNRENEFATMFMNIKDKVTSINVNTKEEFIKNMRKVFKGKTSHIANVKLMQIYFIDQLLKLKKKEQNEYLTDLLFLAQKKGNKVFDFGPFGKLY